MSAGRPLAGLTVAVAGLGPMGRGIARVFARAGATVLVSDVSEAATSAGLERLREEAAVDGDDASAVVGRPLPDALRAADLLVDAVVEDMAAKEQLLAQAREHGGEALLVASNTSSLSVGQMGAAFGDPGRVAGLHFFNPPTKMRLVEVVLGAATADDVRDRMLDLVEALGKTAVTCADSPNFVVNRVCRPLYYEAQLLEMQGVEPAVVDAVARGALGHRMGPLELLDFTGLHTHLASSETALRELGDQRYRPIPRVRQLVRNGMTGRAAGRGFYRYDQETPRDARTRVTEEPAAEPPGLRVTVTGPDAARPAAHPALRDLLADPAVTSDADVVLYACHRTPGVAELDEVRALASAGQRVVVDSSDGAWLRELPAGVGWVRLHTGGERPFAEVVHDPAAGLSPPAHVARLLDAVGAARVVVPVALPGLVADRLAACLANEAYTVVEEGTAGVGDVDLALRLGMNHPHGPFERTELVGRRAVHDTLRSLLEGLGDPRYRPAGLLSRERAAELRAAG